MPPDALLTALVDVATSLPTRTLLDLADRLQAVDDGSRQVALAAICASLPVEASRAGVRQLFETWARHHPELPPQAVSWSVRSAAAVDGWHRAAQSLEIVWTGPAPAGSLLRRTDQALYELVNRAQRELILVTFAAYKVQRLRSALSQAKQRGVSLIFIVESPDVGAGKVSFDPLMGLGKDLDAEVWLWPESQRALDDNGRHGTLHAKCALADSEVMLVSSANFTGDALGINMELGLLVERGEAPRTVRRHFQRLMDEGALQRVE